MLTTAHQLYKETSVSNDKKGRREKQNTTHWTLSPVAKMPSVTYKQTREWKEQGVHPAFLSRTTVKDTYSPGEHGKPSRVEEPDSSVRRGR